MSVPAPVAHAPAAAAYGGTGPVVRTTGMSGAGGAPSAISYTPIDKLNPYTNRWTLRARVTSKGDVKTWDNAKGSGKLMKILIMDESAEIDAVFFKAGVEKYDPILKVGSLYAFSGGQVKAANQQYSKGRQYEISFDDKSQVTAVPEDGRIGAIRYTFVPLREVAVAEVKATLDVIGILSDVKEATEITAKASGKQLTKREITLADDSGVRVDLTLWGSTATNFAGQVGEPCAIKGVTVSDWNGRSLGCSFGAVLQSGVECHSIPRAGELQMWWNNGGQSSGLENLSAGRGSGGGAEGGATGPLADHTQRGTIGEMRSSDPASGDGLPLDEGKLWILKATVAFIKQGGDGDRGPWYYACTQPRGDTGRMCNKKCELSGDGAGSYSCRDCGPTTMACRWIMSMQLSDHTGSTWATAFDEQAEIIMKGKADAFQAILTTQGPDSSEYKVPYEHALYSEWLFTCKNKVRPPPPPFRRVRAPTPPLPLHPPRRLRR